jgi:PAS domain S-box-containing protein/putative nucleotidyltransferase with HDIG domain
MITGLLFGVIAVVGMMNPVTVSPGLIFDGRSVVISASGFIGGWIAAFIAALMSIIYRIWLGGPGAVMGVSVIASSAAIGVAYHYIRAKIPNTTTPLHLIVFGIAVHICMLALTLTLPSEMKYEVFSKIATPVMLIYPIGTLLVCTVLLDVESHLMTEKALERSIGDYKRLFDSSPAGIYQVNFRTGKYIKANNVVCEYHGCSQNEITSHSPIELLTEESRALLFDRLNRMSLGEDVTDTPEYELTLNDGKRMWVQLSSKNIHDSDGVMGADVVAHDITSLKRTEEKYQQTVKSLRKAFGTIIQVMVSAIETRDPYTSGHQIRTADLARAVATEMKLSEEKIEAIRLAGVIHDIGKLGIPSEILSKPAKLTNLEFSLIKEHPQKGYAILKNIESPWPLSQIVYQHHERMDGSGYPRQLKGEEILLEARILAVADVVESMSSHRPYRPALGINAALEEIEKNREKLYDANVVDACLKLFRDKGYRLV